MVWDFSWSFQMFCISFLQYECWEGTLRLKITQGTKPIKNYSIIILWLIQSILDHIGLEFAFARDIRSPIYITNSSIGGLNFMISLRPMLVLVMYVVDLKDLDIVYTNCCNHHLVLMNMFLQLDRRNISTT